MHIEENHECFKCGSYFLDVSTHECPLLDRPPQVGHGNIDTSTFKLISSLHSNTVLTYEYVPDRKFTSISHMFVDINTQIAKLLEELLKELASIKCQFKVLVDLEDLKKGVLKPNKWLSTSFLAVTHPNFIQNYINYALAYINSTLEIYNQNESGLSLKEIHKLQIRITSYILLSGAGYKKLPPCLEGKRGLININAANSYCFHFSVLAGLHSNEAISFYKRRTGKSFEKPLSRLDRRKALSDSSAYTSFFSLYNFSGLQRPVSIDQIDHFEDNNQTISVNCYGLRHKRVTVLRTTKEERDKHVDLLLYNTKKGNHYLTINDLSSFLGKRKKKRHIYCRYCLRRFLQTKSLNKHSKFCFGKRKHEISFPKNDFYQFNNFHETLRFPFSMFFDFETLSVETDKISGAGKVEKLEPEMYSVVVVGPQGYKVCKTYDGPNIICHFLKTVEELADEIRLYLKQTNIMYKLTDEEKCVLQASTKCSFCQTKYTEKNFRVVHHCHYTGKVLTPLGCCSTCNKKARINYLIPALSHAGSKFDHNLIIKGLTKENHKNIKLIPDRHGNFLGFIFNKKVKFMDSFLFYPLKLSKLIKSVKIGNPDAFEIVFQHFRMLKNGDPFYKATGYSDAEIKLLLNKLPFPYELLKDKSCLQLEKLPPIEAFYNSIKGKHIIKESYELVEKIWDIFNVKKFREFFQLYNIMDTLLLACAFQAQRDESFKTFGLDPLHKWSGASYSFSCGMYKSRAKIQYIKDPEMVTMIRSGIRGGPVFLNKRLSVANNERVGNYSESKERTHLLYLDIRSLYPSIFISSPVPISGYEWLSQEELSNLDVLGLPEDNSIGYIFECDLEYSPEFHFFQNDLPMAPVKKKVNLHDLSKLQELILTGKGNNKSSFSSEKLVLNLEDKTEYVTYFKTLKYYLLNGLKLKKLRRGIRFNESPVFREFMTEILAKRAAATTPAMNLALKLPASAFYGKTLQSSANYKDLYICKTRTQALHLSSKAEFHDVYEIDNDLSVFIMNRTGNREDSLFIIGFVVLEMAKKKLMEVHYQGILKQFGRDRAQLLYGDTDGGFYEIQDANNTFISDMKSLSWLIDYSTLDPTHELYDTRIANQPGVFKVEALDILEFVGLSSKLYSYIMPDESGIKKAKGVNKPLLKHKITHEDYVNTLKTFIDFKLDMTIITKDKSHQLYCEQVQKVALSALDCKRHLFLDGIHTLALGHWFIKLLNSPADINSLVTWSDPDKN